jgi:hypothetical protein
LDNLPQNREKQALQAVGNDPRSQPPAEQSPDSVLLDDLLRRLQVADVSRMSLSVSLEHSKGVGGRVGNDRGREPDEGLSEKLLDEVMGRR